MKIKTISKKGQYSPRSHSRGGGGGCFIATAAYGTPYAEEINVLRLWRDNFLKKRALGKKFVLFYYKISPPIANFIRKSEILKKLVRMLLKPLIWILKKIY